MPSITTLFTAMVSWLPAGIGVIILLFFGLMVALLALKLIMWILQLKFW